MNCSSLFLSFTKEYLHSPLILLLAIMLQLPDPSRHKEDKTRRAYRAAKVAFLEILKSYSNLQSVSKLILRAQGDGKANEGGWKLLRSW